MEKGKSLVRGARGFLNPLEGQNKGQRLKRQYDISKIFVLCGRFSKRWVILNKHIRRIRLGFGLPTKYFIEVVGKQILKSVPSGERVTESVLK